jgi:hypothetical protein
MNEPKDKKSPIIFEQEVMSMLEMFGADVEDLIDIWEKEQRLLGPLETIDALIDRKVQDKQAIVPLKKLADSSITRDQRNGAFTRYNFMYGLADLYAQKMEPNTAIFEFDISNAKGTGDFLGDDGIQGLIAVINGIYQRHLAAHGATAVFSFDNAKNDDLKIIVSGLENDEIKAALFSAQEEIDEFVLPLHGIPHTKYNDDIRKGSGSGAGFCMLGRSMDFTEIQRELNVFVEKRKLENAINRNKKCTDCEAVPISAKACKLIMEHKFMIEPYKSDLDVPEKNPYPFRDITISDDKVFDPVEVRKHQLDEYLSDKEYSAETKSVFRKLLGFYDQEEGLTSARKDVHYLGDLKGLMHSFNAASMNVTNVKVDNCAGINKVLSLQHSEAMTKHFVRILQNTLDDELEASNKKAFVYYVGTNSFNIISPHASSEQIEDILNGAFKQKVQEEINDLSIKEYYDGIGMSLPADFKHQKMKMGDIPHSRGEAFKGVGVINICSNEFNSNVTGKELEEFNNVARNGVREADYASDYTLASSLIPTIVAKNPDAAFKALKRLCEDIIEKEQQEVGSSSNDNEEKQRPKRAAGGKSNNESRPSI